MGGLHRRTHATPGPEWRGAPTGDAGGDPQSVLGTMERPLPFPRVGRRLGQGVPGTPGSRDVRHPRRHAIHPVCPGDGRRRRGRGPVLSRARHTLASLGARTNVIMTHTVYNRDRGPEETKRFLEILLKGIDPFREYARRHGLAIHLEGIREGYELEKEFNRAFPMPSHPKFDAHFLMDYEEEWFLSPEGRALLEVLPPIDVVVRHTKLGISGGWIPTRMRKAAYVYSQNGTVHSNWNFNEYAAMVAVTYLAKILHEGEALSKTYASIDEIKARYRDREIRLRQKIVRLSPKPRKLFVVGSPVGLIQVYA